MTPDDRTILKEFVHVGFTGEMYYPVYLKPIDVWVLSSDDDGIIRLPGFYTTDAIRRLCKIDDEELIYLKLKYGICS